MLQCLTAMYHVTLSTSDAPLTIHPVHAHTLHAYDSTSSESEETYSTTDDDNYDGSSDLEAPTGARFPSLNAISGLSKRAKVAPTAPAPRARRGALAPTTKAADQAAGATATKEGAKSNKRIERQGRKDARRSERQAAKEAKREAKAKARDEGAPLPEKTIGEIAEEEGERRREYRRDRLAEARARAAEKKKTRTQSDGACLRHCGTSCGSVLFQTGCACLFIIACFWAVFVGMSIFEIVGITNLPPGIAHGHKVGDYYRS